MTSGPAALVAGVPGTSGERGTARSPRASRRRATARRPRRPSGCRSAARSATAAAARARLRPGSFANRVGRAPGEQLLCVEGEASLVCRERRRAFDGPFVGRLSGHVEAHFATMLETSCRRRRGLPFSTQLVPRDHRRGVLRGERRRHLRARAALSQPTCSPPARPAAAASAAAATRRCSSASARWRSSTSPRRAAVLAAFWVTTLYCRSPSTSVRRAAARAFDAARNFAHTHARRASLRSAAAGRGAPRLCRHGRAVRRHHPHGRLPLRPCLRRLQVPRDPHEDGAPARRPADQEEEVGGSAAARARPSFSKARARSRRRCSSTRLVFIGQLSLDTFYFEGLSVLPVSRLATAARSASSSASAAPPSARFLLPVVKRLAGLVVGEVAGLGVAAEHVAAGA